MTKRHSGESRNPVGSVACSCRKSGWIPSFAERDFSFSALSAQAPSRCTFPIISQQGQLVIGHAPRGTAIEFGGRTGARRCRTARSCSAWSAMRRHRRRCKSATPMAKRNAQASGRQASISHRTRRRSAAEDRDAGSGDRRAHRTRTGRSRRGAQARRCSRGFPARLRLAGAGRAYQRRLRQPAHRQRHAEGAAHRPRHGRADGTPVHAPAAGIVTFAQPDLF